ncbi:hypothetical protein [Streptomyces fumanus]|uniref:hypothetical protein n=1 Tax=Streptomyces fumanus TaxID=67302 RepID=UPI003404A63F
MSDVTRPTGGAPAERGPQTSGEHGRQTPERGPRALGERGSQAPGQRGSQTPDAGGETALGTGPAHGTTGAGGVGPDRGGAGTGPDRAGDAEPLGVRSEHAVGVREEATPNLHTSGSGVPGTERTTEAPPPSPGTPLLPREESDKYGERLHHAVAGFIDDPRGAVEEADRVLEEIATRFTDAVTRRRRTLRGSWQTSSGDTDRKATTADTEQLRLALRDYRELSDRLMHL